MKLAVGRRRYREIMRSSAALALILLLGACGDVAATTTTSELVSPTTTTAAPGISTSTTTGPGTTLRTGPTASTTTVAPGSTLPGEQIDFGPVAGDRLMVVGVSFDDHLNLRQLPGTAFDVIDRIPPTHRDLSALGQTRDIGTSFWIQVDFDGVVGWVHFGFIAYEGLTDDLTAYVVDQLGERPTAGSMTELGQIVAALFSSEEPQSSLVEVVDEMVGDLGEITFDVLGFGDDSVRGVRLHVFGEPFEGGFALRSLEVTYLCGRGVTDEGICV